MATTNRIDYEMRHGLSKEDATKQRAEYLAFLNLDDPILTASLALAKTLEDPEAGNDEVRDAAIDLIREIQADYDNKTPKPPHEETN